jgi:iron complex outermembrane receptor protein
MRSNDKMRTHSLPLAIVLSVALAPVGAARNASASPSDATQQAKAHFAAGRQHVARHEYDEAIREFETGYQLKPLPLFLYNIGQVARVAGNNAKALDAFERYLQAEPKAPDRAEVERWIASLREAVNKEKAAAPSSALPPPTVPPPSATLTPSAPDATAAPAAAVLAPAPAATDAPRPRSRKTLWIVLGTVGGALVIGGVATAIALSVHPGNDLPSGYHDLGGLSLGRQ